MFRATQTYDNAQVTDPDFKRACSRCVFWGLCHILFVFREVVGSSAVVENLKILLEGISKTLGSMA